MLFEVLGDGSVALRLCTGVLLTSNAGKCLEHFIRLVEGDESLLVSDSNKGVDLINTERESLLELRNLGEVGVGGGSSSKSESHVSEQLLMSMYSGENADASGSTGISSSSCSSSDQLISFLI